MKDLWRIMITQIRLIFPLFDVYCLYISDTANIEIVAFAPSFQNSQVRKKLTLQIFWPVWTRVAWGGIHKVPKSNWDFVPAEAQGQEFPVKDPQLVFLWLLHGAILREALWSLGAPKQSVLIRVSETGKTALEFRMPWKVNPLERKVSGRRKSQDISVLSWSDMLPCPHQRWHVGVCLDGKADFLTALEHPKSNLLWCQRQSKTTHSVVRSSCQS